MTTLDEFWSLVVAEVLELGHSPREIFIERFGDLPYRGWSLPMLRWVAREQSWVSQRRAFRDADLTRMAIGSIFDEKGSRSWSRIRAEVGG